MVGNLLIQMTKEYVLNSLSNELITTGPYVERFEKSTK